MWKAVIIDDEPVIVDGFKKLIDWQDYGIKIIGEAHDGEEGYSMLQALEPDIALLDIMLPTISGLDIIKRLYESSCKTKIIFISGHEEFSFAKDALHFGAVDYLLKPVAAAELSATVEKAISMLKDQSTISVFRKENRMQNIFKDINEGDEYAETELYEQFVSTNLDLDKKIFVGICFGIIGFHNEEMPYEQQELKRFVIYNTIHEYFIKNSNGFMVKKEKESCNLIGIFEENEREAFYEKYISRIKLEIEQEFGVRLCIGMGTPTTTTSRLKQTFKEAKYAHELYFFEEKTVMDFRYAGRKKPVEIDKIDRLFEITFKSILFKNGKVLMNIENILDAIGESHYGNRFAAINRCLIFSGDLMKKLMQYHLSEGDFQIKQDSLQAAIQYKKTYRELKKYLLEYYENLLPDIYSHMGQKECRGVERAKDYIKANYMHSFTLKEISDIACVSQNYFSALFKRQTGENYKSYVTRIRMDAAINMVINTDMKTYEIAEAVGYNNVRRFVDSFKSIYLMSPMEYRKGYN